MLSVSRPQKFHEGITNECEALSEMRIGRRNPSTGIKLVPEAILPPQIPYDMTWNRTRVALLEAGEPTTKPRVTYNNTI
jgi:hypothetical protein